MARSRPKPVQFQVRPVTHGLNNSMPPQLIDMRETPSAMNNRFEAGQLKTRSGFKMKYRGADETLLWVDQAYPPGGGTGNLVAFGLSQLWYEDGGTGVLMRADAFDTAGDPLDPPFGLEPSLDVPVVDVGSGQYVFVGAHAAAAYPSDSEYADIGVFCAGTADGVFVFAYTGQDTVVEIERIGGDAPTSARCVAIYDQRIIAGGIVAAGAGTDNYSMIQWSSKGVFSDWTTASGGGSTIIGDSPDWIQAMKRLGASLIVYKERSIYIGRKTYLADPPFRFDPAPGQGIGCASPNSIGDLGEEHIFLGWDDVYTFSLKGLVPIGTRIRDELFYGPNGINPEYLILTTGIIAEEYDEYWLFVASGKWPGTSAAPLTNIMTNPIFNQGADGVTPTGWTATTDGDGTALNNVDNGDTFGPNTCDMTRSTGTNVSIRQSYDYNEVIDAQRFSAVVWLSSPDDDVAYDILLYSRNSAGGGRESLVDNASLAGTVSDADGVVRVVLSGTVDDADAEMAEVSIKASTASKTLEVHGVHLVRIDNLDAKYITGLTGAEDPGYILATDEVQVIPLIIDKVGDWIPDTVWCYNYEENAWAAWRMPMTGFGYDVLQPVISIGSLVGTIEKQTWRYDEKRLTELAPTNLIAQPDGRIYEVSNEATLDWQDTFGTAIMCFWESKDFDFDQPQMDKTFSRLVIFHNTDHPSVDITVGVSTDSGITYQDQIVTMRTGYTTTFADFFVTGPQVRFRVRTDTAGFYINGFGVKIIPRGEINPY